MQKIALYAASLASLGELISNGLLLWEEAARSKPDSHLKSISDIPQDILTSDPDLVCMMVLEGFIVPIRWKKLSPYPYQGLLISAVYLFSAKQFNELDDAPKAWGALVQAYYYLGTNSSLTVQESAASAARARHEKHTGKLKDAVLKILSDLGPDVTSIAEARRRVCIAFSSPVYADALQDFNDSVAKPPRHDKSKTPVDRLDDLLGKWALPGSPHPEISLAFGRFKRGANCRRS